jgi:hypothetical protein
MGFARNLCGADDNSSGGAPDYPVSAEDRAYSAAKAAEWLLRVQNGEHVDPFDDVAKRAKREFDRMIGLRYRDSSAYVMSWCDAVYEDTCTEWIASATAIHRILLFQAK